MGGSGFAIFQGNREAEQDNSAPARMKKSCGKQPEGRSAETKLQGGGRTEEG